MTNDVPWNPLVRVSVTAATNSFCVAYEETLPAPLVATNVIGGGEWLADRQTIRWGAFTGTQSTVLTYRVHGLPGTYGMDGRLSLDGYWAFFPADAAVTIAAEDGGTEPPPRPGTVAPPVLTPTSSTSLPVTVSMSCATTGAVIRYTTDGSVPNTADNLYTGAVEIVADTLIRARAFASNAFPSSVRNGYYQQVPALPALSVSSTVSTNTPSLPGLSIAVTQAVSGTCWTYALFLPAVLSASNVTENGTFDETNRVVRWGAFTGRTNAVLACELAGPAGTYSVAGRWSIDGRGADTAPVSVAIAGTTDDTQVPPRPGTVAAPVLDPSSSTSLPVTVSISCATTGAVIRYTTDGSLPDEGDTLYSVPVQIVAETLVRARGFASDSFPSSVRSGYYRQAVPTPALSVTNQISTNTPWAPELTISVSQPDGVKCWTYEQPLPVMLSASNITENGVFDATNHVVRWGPFIGRTNAVLDCQLAGPPGTYLLTGRWSVDGYGTEAAPISVTIAGTNEDWTIPERPQSVAKPVFSPSSSVQLPVSVTISCATPDAEIRYTVDGSAPFEASALYTNAVPFSHAGTLRAKAYKAGLLPSAPAVGAYGQRPPVQLIQVTRSISANGTPAPAVELLVAPPAGARCYTVTETIPDRIAPYGISHNGSWSDADRTIHWGPFIGADSVRLSYRLTGMPGSYRLAGAGSADGRGNATTGSDMVEMAAPEFAPDLVPASIRFERAIAVTYSVTNSGRGVAMAWSTARWHDTFYLSRNATLDAGDTMVGRFIGNDGMPLANGASYTASQTLSLPEGAGGNYYLILRTDEREIVYEANEANNVLAVPITVPVLEGTPERALDMPAVWGGAAQPGSLDFSPDGVRLAAAVGARVAVWNLQSAENATNAFIGSFGGHADRVTSVDFSPAGDEVLSGARDGTMRIWDARTFAEARQIAATAGEPTPAAFAADGAMVLGGAARNVARVWDAVTTTNILQTLSGHAGSITAVAFSPDGTKALTGGSDKSAILWDVATGAILYRWTNHAQIVSAVAISPDGTRALTVCGDGVIRIWSTTTGATVTDLRQGKPLSGAVFSPDGLYVASADRGWPGQVFLWDVASGQVLRTFRPFNANPSTVEAVAFSPDRTAIATSHSDGRIRLWDTGLAAVPILPVTPLPIGTDVPVVMRSHGLYYFEVDVPAQRSLVVTVDAAGGGGGGGMAPLAMSVGRGADPLPGVRFANRAVTEPQSGKGGVVALAMTDFPPESDIEAFRVLATRQHLPSVYEYDHFAQAFVSDLHAEVPLSANVAGKCYMLVFAPWLSAGQITATVRATFADFHISKVSPSTAGNSGDATLKVEGLGFTPDTIPVLVGLTHSITGQVSMYRNSTLMHTTFDLRGAPAEAYDLRVEKRGSIPATADDALTVTAGTGPVLTSRLIAPPAIRSGREYTLQVEYANTGDADMAAPLFVVSAKMGWPVFICYMMPLLRPGEVWVRPPPPPDNRPKVSVLQVLGLNQDGPPGVLPPGAKQQTQVSFQYDGTETLMEFALEALRADATPIDWPSLESKMRPADMTDDLWAALWANFQWQVGNTWADYLRALNDQANLMAQSGATTFDAATLVAGIFGQAAGSAYRRTLAAEVDASAPAPALPLQFARFCTDGLEHRFALGPLGRGWSHGFEYALTHPTNNVIAIATPGGGSRRFTLASDGGWYGGQGEYASLTVSTDGSAALTEKEGTVRRFNAAGQFTAIEEPNGNRITLAYSGERLTTLTHSAGPAFQLQYNGQGRISRLTDHADQVTTCDYDGSGEHLVRVTAPGNAVTEYAYSGANRTPSAHALTAIAFPDNTHRCFAYNAQGFLSEESRDGGAERIRYTYDRTGVVTVRDALDAVTTMRVGTRGQLLQMADPLGRPLTMTYDFDHNLTRLIGPSGDTSEMEYDAQGNTEGIVNPLGHEVAMSHGALNRLSALTDARAQTTDFGYDPRGNLTGITYPDTSAETFGYNAAGGLTTFRNRRGQTIQYTRNSVGQITRKTYPDGRTVDYTYNSRGYLTRVADSAQGTTTMGYDSRSYMTNIVYPDGKGFSFQYNAAGRRTRRVGHDGYTLVYAYDAAGRLQSLNQGGTNELVRYAYDSAGRLSREDKGNGTYTTYAYDAAGQVLSMVNYTPGGGVQSFFNYIYDARGNRTSMTTADGVTTYQYDLLNQLVGVTYPSGRTVTYAYDAAGNRTVVTENGVPTAYTANELNQYTEVGGATYTYDADGNMTGKTDASGTTTYEYDVENRLVGIRIPTNGVWQYTYDALGNRTMVVHDGVTNRYLHDPIGLVDVVGEYDGAGGLVARYDHALGLVARTEAAMGVVFYAYDAIGSTRQITGPLGEILNHYDYDSFGRLMGSQEQVPNTQQYVGRAGVADEGFGGMFMRARHYSPETGQFFSNDPIGLLGGINLRRYAGNNPVRYADPSGWWRIVTVYFWLDVPGHAAVEVNGEYLSKYPALSVGKNSGAVTPDYVEKHRQSDIGKALPFSIVVSDATAEAMARKIKALKAAASDFDLRRANCVDDVDAVLAAGGLPVYVSYPPHELLLKMALLYSLAGAFDVLAEAAVSVVRPVDPNDKLSPEGVGPDRLVSGQDEIEYMIRFENMPAANAPVQDLVVVDYLDPNLDWSTVELSEIRYGDRLVTVPAGQLNFSTRDIPPTNSIAIMGTVQGRLAVDITANLNAQNGRLEWRLVAKDTQDNKYPDDALAGFLPPNSTNTHCGEGHVTFRVKPKPGLAIGTRIENKASIVFDLNDPIETPVIFNTIGQVDPKLGASIAYLASQMSLGLPFTFSLTVNNTGMNVASNVVVTNAIPTGFDFVSATGTVGTVVYTNGAIVWTIGDLSNGVPATLTIALTPTQEGFFTIPILVGGGDGLTYNVNPLVNVGPPFIGLGSQGAGSIEVYAPGAATAYTFQVSHDLTKSPPIWQPVTNVPILDNNRLVITVSPTNTSFYRLKRDQ